MADGELTLKLDDDTLRRLQEAADAVGRPMDSYAADVLAGALSDHWLGAHEAVAEFDRTGESHDAETVMAEFKANVAKRAAKA